MEFVNWLAILASTVSAFILGYFWYNPMLFGKKWQRENQITDEALQTGNMGKIFGNAFMMTLVYSLILAKTLIRTDYNGMADGLKFGFMMGIGIAAMGLGVIYQFSRKSSTLFLIDAGYLVLSSTVIGAILGAMG